MVQRKLAVLAAVLMLTGCGNRIGENGDISASEHTVTKTETTTTAPEEPPAEEVTTSSEAEIIPAELPFEEFEQTVEAEDGEITGNAVIASEREAFSGEGYVSALDTDGGLVLTFNVPEAQYYNIFAAVAAEKKSSCSLGINASHIGDFEVAEDDKFSLVTFYNIYLEKGEAQLALTVNSGTIDVDYATVQSSTEVRDLQLTLDKPSLVNKNADYNAQALYQYLCDSYGKTILTGQHDTVGTLTETRKIYELTGRYPAIRFGDLMPFTQDMIMGENELEYAERYYSEGGIISYMWHWIDPIGGLSYYADETDFDLSKAVTEEKISELSIEELEKLHEEEKISDECLAIVKDIDKISEKLGELQEQGIAVIWRPLHEASNGYFWWGHDVDSYKWLWQLLYERQTNYHKLNNLIWVWSAQNAGWYVGDDSCDIVSVDIYDKGNLSGHAERMLFLQKIAPNKLIAMSECGTLPSIQSAANEHTIWSYIGQWGGSFLLNDEAGLNTEYNSLEDLVLFYSNDLTVTRDELPDLKAKAAELEAAAKENEVASEPDDSSAAADESSSTDESSEQEESSEKEE
ncbi:MAG: glycoside hydrolase [Ruminococcus sp.]|nr:glycoside hydrolase [Ruminococcus sp.]